MHCSHDLSSHGTLSQWRRRTQWYKYSPTHSPLLHSSLISHYILACIADSMTDTQDATWHRNVKFYGFTPVVRDPDVLFADHPTASGSSPKQLPFTVDDFPLPNSPVVTAVKQFVKVSPRNGMHNHKVRLKSCPQNELNEQTFNHSNRVYYYGKQIFDVSSSKLS